MNYNNIKNFHAVVELKSLSAAANYLHISQPALSKSIKNLEQEIGCMLFEHGKNKMHVNNNGMRYYAFTKEYFFKYDKLVSELQESNGLKSNELSIAFSSAGTIIPRLIHGFKQRYPQSRFTLTTRNPDAVDTASHFVFLATYEKVALPYYHLLFQEPLYLTVSCHHSLAGEKEASLAALNTESFVFPGRSNDMYKIMMHYCHLAGLRPQPNIIERNNVMLTLISLNEGIAIMPAIRDTALADNRIIQLNIKDFPCYRYVYLVENNKVYSSKLAQFFKQYCTHFEYKL